MGPYAPERLLSCRAPRSPKTAWPAPSSRALCCPRSPGTATPLRPLPTSYPYSPGYKAYREARHERHLGLTTETGQRQDAPDQHLPIMLQRTSTQCLAGFEPGRRGCPRRLARLEIGSRRLHAVAGPASLSPRACSSRWRGLTSRTTGTLSPCPEAPRAFAQVTPGSWPRSARPDPS